MKQTHPLNEVGFLPSLLHRRYANEFPSNVFPSATRCQYDQIEVSVWNDGSTDGSAVLVEAFRAAFEAVGAKLILGGTGAGPARGCGLAD